MSLNGDQKKDFFGGCQAVEMKSREVYLFNKINRRFRGTNKGNSELFFPYLLQLVQANQTKLSMKKFPDTLVIMLGGILLAWILTFIIPQGAYTRLEDPETGRNMVVPGSYEEVTAESLDFFDLILSIPEGIISRADLIVLILLVGGSFYVIEKTGALGQGLQRVVDLLQGRESVALAIVSLLFTVAGTTIGLQEEVIAMAPILILFGRSMGFDALSALGVSYGSAVIGSAFSPMNPFGVVIAQQEAELPLLSGTPFRLWFLALAFILWTAYMIRYARRNRCEKQPMATHGQSLSVGNLVILLMLCSTFALVTWGLMWWGWGFNELSACFFTLGLAAGILGNLGINGTGKAFAEGFREMIFAGVILGLASSITLLLQKGTVIDTLVYELFSPMEGLPSSVLALGMLGSQAILHFPVPSYSGQAILTMPILVPLSDLAAVTRQTCVLAYQYGAINMDLIIPTNGALMGVLAVAGISFDRWMRFIWKPLLLIFLLAALAIVVAVQTGYS